MNYYNENDKDAAAWLEFLIEDKLIPYGEVDKRSIEDVEPNDLRDYTQCHFFAGIGGWPLALQIAGWPTEKSVWTGSCRCQPFSNSGNKQGSMDSRHLFPAWFNLIRECKPTTIYGEQVASKLGIEWLDDVSSKMESESYAFGSMVLPGNLFGASHQRERIYFVAHSNGFRQQGSRGCEQPVYPTQENFRQADRFVNAVQGNSLPFLCPSHDGVSPKLAKVLLKGAGNAIIPQVASSFILASI